MLLFRPCIDGWDSSLDLRRQQWPEWGCPRVFIMDDFRGRYVQHISLLVRLAQIVKFAFLENIQGSGRETCATKNESVQ